MDIPRTALRTFDAGGGRTLRYHALPALQEAGWGDISRLPVCLRIVLESSLRNLDGRRVRERDVRHLAGWKPEAPRTEEVPLLVSRVLLQDFTGVPLVVDLAAMRSALERAGRDPAMVEPRVPVDLVVDHSVQVDYYGRPDAAARNYRIELERNLPRYELLKWGAQAFAAFRIVPPGIGICHQVNLELLAEVVSERDGLCFFDTLVGTDSHTTMVNGLGVLGWGVGGIEAEAAMLGQPVYFLMPDVVGVHLRGALREGVTGTDLVLAVTELLRRTKVVGKLVEFFGDGAASLPVAERATIANMAPEYGATAGFFPIDEATCRYLAVTGRDEAHIERIRRYCRAQGLFGMPRLGDCDYSLVVELDLGGIAPSVSGPRRPQDRVDLGELKSRWAELVAAAPPAGFGRGPEASAARHRVLLGTHDGRAPLRGGGEQDPDTVPDARRTDTSGLTEYEMMNNRPTPDPVGRNGLERPRATATVGDGDVLIAAITSCTNTSNPSVMLAAGLLARKAVARGLRVSPAVKTSLAPGSRVVTDYLRKTGLQASLDALGFELVGYGCTTCIGNSGPLDPAIEEAIAAHGLVGVSVLSGNRNFEARVHQSLRANFLMSPPLVVAFAIAGRIGIDLTREPLGRGHDGEEVFLSDVWPTAAELEAVLPEAEDAGTYRARYRDVTGESPEWNAIPAPRGAVYRWDPNATYVREPPYFRGEPFVASDVRGARVLAVFGDSVTTDHISPAGAIKPSSPAGTYLQAHGVPVAQFNSYGARRGNHEVMVRGTFANVRIRNLLAGGAEGGVTVHRPSGDRLPIYDAAMRYAAEGVPLFIFAGSEYGAGSSRDWAAKGTRLLGVRAVIARSFERIHRSNLVGVGVLPCELPEGESAASLCIDGTETFDLAGLDGGIQPHQTLTLTLRREDGRTREVPLRLRIDAPMEVEYYRAGGILPYVLGELLRAPG